MAECEVKTTVTEVTLKLNEKEARTVLDIMNCIAGAPMGSRRRHADSVASVLTRAGIQGSTGVPSDIDPEQDAIRFKEGAE